ncbi:MAG: hypothetical protein ACREBR_03065 [bacterium]
MATIVRAERLAAAPRKTRTTTTTETTRLVARSAVTTAVLQQDCVPQLPLQLP